MNTVRTRADSWVPVMRVAAVVVAGCGVVVQAVLEKTFIPPLAVLDVALVTGALISRRPGGERRGRLVMGVASVVFVLLAVPFDLPHLAHPDSWLPFVTATTSVVGALVGVVGLIGMASGGVDRAARAVSAATVVVVAGAVVVGGLASASAGSDAAVQGDVAVRAHGIAFQPTEIGAAAGQVSVRVDNADLVTHTFAVDGLGVDVTVPAGKARRVTFTAQPGTYRFHCTIAGHQNMKGTIVVS